MFRDFLPPPVRRSAVGGRQGRLAIAQAACAEPANLGCEHPEVDVELECGRPDARTYLLRAADPAGPCVRKTERVAGSPPASPRPTDRRRSQRQFVPGHEMIARAAGRQSSSPRRTPTTNRRGAPLGKRRGRRGPPEASGGAVPASRFAKLPLQIVQLCLELLLRRPRRADEPPQLGNRHLRTSRRSDTA